VLYRSFAILWDPIRRFLILQQSYKSLVFCSGIFSLWPYLLGSSPTFSSITFSVSGFMWSSLIHLDLSFVQEIRMDQFSFFCMLTTGWTSKIYWNAVFFFLPLLDDFSFFVKDQVTIVVWVHFWDFNSIPLIYLPVAVPTPYSFYHYYSVKQFETRDGDSPRSSFIADNSFDYPVFLLLLLFPVNLQIVLSDSMKNWVGILMGISLNL
jgi:hypothetical protein